MLGWFPKHLRLVPAITKLSVSQSDEADNQSSNWVQRFEQAGWEWTGLLDMITVSPLSLNWQQRIYLKIYSRLVQQRAAVWHKREFTRILQRKVRLLLLEVFTLSECSLSKNVNWSCKKTNCVSIATPNRLGFGRVLPPVPGIQRQSGLALLQRARAAGGLSGLIQTHIQTPAETF